MRITVQLLTNLSESNPDLLSAIANNFGFTVAQLKLKAATEPLELVGLLETMLSNLGY